VFNGNGKVNDNNPQKDFVARLDMNFGKEHTFGAYTLQGATSYEYNGTAPTNLADLEDKPATSNMGAFYRFQTDQLHAAAEFITGTMGRRYAAREHLEQQFMGFVATVGYAFSKKHRVVLRYDYLNFNSGDDWYGPASPYVSTAADFVDFPALAYTAGDYSPAYWETTLGYTYALGDDYRKACVRVNYIMRSKNFLEPRFGAGQTGPQGGDSLVVAYQVGF
jgi:hypothetical protein